MENEDGPVTVSLNLDGQTFESLCLFDADREDREDGHDAEAA